MKIPINRSMRCANTACCCAFVWCLLVLNNANAAQPPLARLKAFLATTHTLTADFKQVTLDQNKQPIQTSGGSFYLSRPGKFRWQYTTPFVQEIIANDGKIYFYDADIEQLTIKKIDASLSATPALLLSGKLALETNFELQQQNADANLQWIKLAPKNKASSFNYIRIEFNPTSLSAMELSDNFGQLTRIYFSKVKTNPALSNDIFEFRVPEGVDIFEN